MRVGANAAERSFRNMKALRAGSEFGECRQALGKVEERFFLLLEEMERQTFREFWTDGGKGREMLDEFFERLWVHKLFTFTFTAALHGNVRAI